MGILERSAPVIFVCVSISLMVLFGVIATERPLTEVEAIVLQFLTLCSGLFGSYIFGRQTSQNKLKEMMTPYARSAFRRLISLYHSLSRVAGIIEGNSDDSLKVYTIRAIVIEQIATANDALADWQDIVPELVDELRKGIETDGK